MQAHSHLNKLLPSGIVLTTIFAITTFATSSESQNADVTHNYVQPNAAVPLHPAEAPLKPEEGLNVPHTDAQAKARASSSYGKLPISFELNQGQADGTVQFLARGMGYTLSLMPGEAVLSLHAVHPTPKGKRPEAQSSATVSTVGLKLIGANTKAEVVGVDPLPGKANYFVGNDRAKWHTDIPTYAKVRYSDVYPGVDLVYYGNQEGRLEHDFIVAPGADPNAITISLRANEGAVADGNGGLTLHTKSGELTLHQPVVYQELGGERKIISAAYELAKNDEIKFRLGSYDKNAPLIIDPVLVYSAVFGSNNLDYVASIAIDAARNVYLTGYTAFLDNSIANPTFILKLNSSGTALVYSAYLSGTSGDSSGTSIAVDSAGRAYVSGHTEGYGFPVVNAYQPNFGGGGTDGFISALNPAGNALVWSTYLGGNYDDWGNAVALDPSGNLYVTGVTWGSFPALHPIPGTQCSTNTNAACIWVAKFSSAGALQYSTTYSLGWSWAIAADSKGSAYITGVAVVNTPPTTGGAFRSTCVPLSGPLETAIDLVGCAFVAKLSPMGDSLVYSTTLGAIPSTGHAIAVDSGLNAYVGGQSGRGLPVWSTGFQRTFGGGSRDGFVVKLNAEGSNLIWSTYLGGSGDDFIQGLVLDQNRNVYVSGYTSSPNFPLKAPIQSYTGTSDYQPYQYFVATLSPSLSSIPYYSTYFGSQTWNYQGQEWAKIAVDPALNVYLTGVDQNTVQPTSGAYTAGSSRDIFVSKLVIMDDLALGVSATPSPVTHGGNLTYTIAVTSKGPDFGANVRVADTLPAGTTFVSYNAGGGSCVAPAVGGTGTINCTLPQLNKGATWNVKLTVKVSAASGSTLSNTAAAISNMQDFVPGNNSGTLTTHVN